MLDAYCCLQVYVDENQSGSRETFVYVNGICTTSRMARATGLELAQMMHKNVTVVHNPTDSALMDLGEVGLVASHMPSRSNFAMRGCHFGGFYS